MKRFAGFIIGACALVFASFNIFAASGDIAGEYYYTDIRTTLNGVEIDAINIGGDTLISAEDMHYYSFSVYWSPEERGLFIWSMPHATNGIPPKVERPDGVAGQVRGNYYETDIITRLDDKPITAYNIGGRTYIHAEAMRDFGYQVDWDPEKWELRVVSPDRAGYLYDFPLTYDKEQSEQGIGNFSVIYSDGKIFGTGDAEYFQSSFRQETTGSYVFDMRFYQNAGLFFSDILQDKMRPLAYTGYGVEEALTPEDKYDLANSIITFTVNGVTAKKVSVASGAGNGHRDFYVRAYDLPKLKKNEIREIKISVGEPSGEPFEIVTPESYKDDAAYIFESLRKYPNDYFITSSQSDDYKIIYMCESETLGAVCHRLYAVNSKTGKTSEDILDKVRKFEGFEAKKLNAFSFRIEGDKFYFSCAPGKTGDFCADLKNGEVQLIAENIW